MHAHKRVEWQLLYLSTGELGPARHIQSATGQKQRLYGGQEVRFCEIPAQVDDKGGAFDFVDPPRVFSVEPGKTKINSGLDSVIATMHPGERWVVIVPPALGYGRAGLYPPETAGQRC
jgi:hypothetical protein